MLHYLDDFFTILPPQTNAKVYYHDFELICSYLGIIINHIKDIKGIKVDFLGIELNSILMQRRLPSNKLFRARNIVNNLKRRIISRYKLELAIDFLLFIVKIIILDRVFLR